jgi:hypothetical protein
MEAVWRRLGSPALSAQYVGEGTQISKKKSKKIFILISDSHFEAYDLRKTTFSNTFSWFELS